MGVSRSGYYKWKKRDKSTRDLKREEVIALVSEVHKAHPSHDYRWVAAFIRVNYQQDISDNYVYKAFRFLGIKAKTKHQVHYRHRYSHGNYLNAVAGGSSIWTVLRMSLSCCVGRKNQPLSIPTKALCIHQKRTTN